MKTHGCKGKPSIQLDKLSTLLKALEESILDFLNISWIRDVDLC